MKKILAFLLVLSMCLSPCNALAIEADTNGYLIESAGGGDSFNETVETGLLSNKRAVLNDEVAAVDYVAEIEVDVEDAVEDGVEKTDEIQVNASAYHNTIIIHEDFVGSEHRYQTNIEIPFTLYQLGYSNEKYYVDIYNENGELVAEGSGTYGTGVGVAEDTFVWEGKPDPGEYWINFYSTVSNELDEYAFPFYVLPEDVSGLKAETIGPNQTKLSWDASYGADGYLVYGQKDGKYGYVGMTTKGTTFTDKKALGADFNFYWVFPYTQDSENGMHPSRCLKYVYAKGVCLAPTNFRATSVEGGVKLTWNASYGAEGYLIYGIVNNQKYGYVGMTTKGTTFTDRKASKDVWNFYWVFPYHEEEINGQNKMITGYIPDYVWGKAK